METKSLEQPYSEISVNTLKAGFPTRIRRDIGAVEFAYTMDGGSAWFTVSHRDGKYTVTMEPNHPSGLGSVVGTGSDADLPTATLLATADMIVNAAKAESI